MSLSSSILSRYRGRHREDWPYGLAPAPRAPRKPTVLELYHTVPVDIEEIARLTGVRIVRRNLPDKTAAILHRVDCEAWYLYLNERHCIERQRFTVGHELSHVYQTRGTWPPSPPERDPQRIRRYERLADSSAGNYLMPEGYIRMWLAEQIPIPEMAKRFIVSEEALKIRIGEVLEAERKRAEYRRIPDTMRVADASTAAER